MAHPIALDVPVRDPRIELQRRLEDAPAEHAAALLAGYEVLQGLQDTANGSKLIVMRFTPREDAQQDSMSAKPVEVEVDSNFNNLRAFFDSMAKLPRIHSSRIFITI